MTKLQKNQKLKLIDGRSITVTNKLGEGGQGIVYEVQIDGSKEKKALKWYFINKIKMPTRFFDHLKSNIQAGSPSSIFIWPEELTEYIGNTFGYIMKIYPKEYKSFSKFIMAQTSFASLEAMTNAALEIVTAFSNLHDNGYNYQDLNDGNLAINPTTGNVLICDNDNVMGHGQKSDVLGKARYMAPEVVRGEKTPDKLTDRYSLAVILFMLFAGNHPLEGSKSNVPCLTNKHDKRIFGKEPIFIFDVNNDENKPVEGLHSNALNAWDCFPSYLKESFQESFSQESLLQIKNRLTEKEWIHILMRLKTSIVDCPHCKTRIFIESDKNCTCSECKKPITVAGYLLFKKRAQREVKVPIFENISLYEYHMRDSSTDYTTKAAEILVKPGKYGLKNLSQYSWEITSKDGSISQKKQNEVVVLSSGTIIDFGNQNIIEIIQN